jgi:hypothetical protein
MGVPFVNLRIPSTVFSYLAKWAGHDGDAILKAGGAKQPLESFDFPNYVMKARFEKTEKDISSPNVLGRAAGQRPRS